LSRYVDAILIRTHAHAPLRSFADAARVPVINGLSEAHHPCQALADLLTIKERLRGLGGKTLAFIGDAGNNVATSLAQAALSAGMHVRFGCPPEHRPRPGVIEAARRAGRARKPFLRIFAHAARAARNADVVYTDAWVSMGEKAAHRRKHAALRAYRVDDAVLSAAKPGALVMHCLPAHRGEEIDASVIDGPNSVVFDQAENRLHAQKALLVSILGAMALDGRVTGGSS
jgi:ornithine carbamoyltransferase